MSTVARAVTAWSGDKTGAAARLIATGTVTGGDAARDTGNLVTTKEALEADLGVP
jgi:hypothetical protein